MINKLQSFRTRRVCALAVGLVAALLPRSAMSIVGGVTGEEAGYWENHSVVLAEVIELTEAKGDDYFDRLRLRPISTLSGRFDSGASSELNTGAEIFTSISVIHAYPKPGQLILGVLEYVPARLSSTPGYYIKNGFATFMPPRATGGRHRVNLRIIEQTESATVDDAVVTIQKVRKISDAKPSRWPRGLFDTPAPSGFWRSHCLICADVDAVRYPETMGPAAQLTLLPKMTISGQFDAGKTPTITVEARVRAGISLPTAGDKILILLARDGDSYSVYPERAEFMPGEHAPIQTIVDYLGPRVLDAAKAVQEARAKEQKAEKDNAKAEKDK